MESVFPRVNITPETENYAEHPLHQDFDIPEILSIATAKENLPFGYQFYLVDFASKKLPGTDFILDTLDYFAHLEAEQFGGLSIYYRGDAYGEFLEMCRSFCAWRSIEEAQTASRKPAHGQAAQAVPYLYEWYQVTVRRAWLDDSKEGFQFDQEGTHSSDGLNHLIDLAA